MTVIEPDDIGTDEMAARRILVHARIIAPCLDSLAGDPRKNAIAILTGVYDELPEKGSRRARQLSRNGTSISYDSVASAFTDDDVRGLQSLCGAAAAVEIPGLPAGSFPQPDPVISRAWPEGRYLR